MRNAITGLLLFFLAGFTTNAQGLFESSQTEGVGLESGSALSIGGFIRSVAYVGLTPEAKKSYLQSAYAQAGLRLEAKAGSWARAKADLRFRYGTEWQTDVSAMDLRELYVDVFAGPAGFRFGKMITPWGKGSMINPSDKITPLDPTVRSPEEDDMKLGFWGLQAYMNMGPLMKLTATWKPVYQSSVLLIDPVPMPGYVNFLDADFPGLELKEGSYGLNFDVHAPVLDLSLYWFDGYMHWPGIAFQSFEVDGQDMEPQALNLFEKAYRIRSLGMDLSLPLASWIMRVEGTWQQTDGSHSDHEYLPFPELSYTAEIERSGTHLTLLGGYYGKYILEYENAEADPSLSAGEDQLEELMKSGIPLTMDLMEQIIRDRIASFNRLYNYQLEKFYHSVFLILKADLLQDRLELSVPAMYNLTSEEWIFQPGISWKPYDGIRVAAGYSGMLGPQNSLYDLVGPVLNAGYLSFRLTF